MSDKRRFFVVMIIPLLVLGASGIVCQTVLLRELLILFAGNELSLGMIIGAWVVCEAAGSYTAGRKSGLLSNNANFFVYASLLFSLLFPAAIFLARFYKPLAGIPLELGGGFGLVVGASFLVLFPVAFIHGFLFIGACSLYGQLTGTWTEAAGKVYFWETAGTIIGGVAVSYLLIPHLDSYQTGMTMALVNGAACALLAFGIGKGGMRLSMVTAGLFSLAMLVFIISGGAERLQKSSLAGEWKGKNLVAYRNSFYQNIAVVRDEGQYTFFTDGIPAVTTPVPDIGRVEELVHLPLLAHPGPRSVLVLGGGAGGVLAEVLKYPDLQRVDYVESDPALLQAIADFPTPLTTAELGNLLVHHHYGDPRLFLRQTSHRYDIILLNIPLPQTLQANRLFTRECFAAIRGVMRQGGILAVPVTGSLTYYGDELKMVNASCLATLAAVFPHRLIVPGDTNLVLSSTAPDVETVTPKLLAARLAARGVITRLVTPDYMAYRFEKEKATWLNELMEGVTARKNRDFSPMGLYYSMAYRNLLFSPQMKWLFDRAGRLPLTAALGVALGLPLLLIPLSGKYPVTTLPLVIAGTGFSAMIFELLLFFAFQVLYGHVYYLVGMLTGAFMAGAAAGSLAVTRSLARIGSGKRTLLLMEGGIVLFALLLSLFFSLVAGTESAVPLSVYPFIPFLLVVAGFLTGMEFPLAVRLHARHYTASPSPLEKDTGLIFGADLAGGFLGGVLGGAFLLPVLGFVNCCILVAALKAGTFMLAAFAGEA